MNGQGNNAKFERKKESKSEHVIDQLRPELRSEFPASARWQLVAFTYKAINFGVEKSFPILLLGVFLTLSP